MTECHAVCMWSWCESQKVFSPKPYILPQRTPTFFEVNKLKSEERPEATRSSMQHLSEHPQAHLWPPADESFEWCIVQWYHSQRQALARLHEKYAKELASIEERLKNAEAELSGLSEPVQVQSWCLPRVPKAFDDLFFYAPALQRRGGKPSKASTCNLCDAARLIHNSQASSNFSSKSCRCSAVNMKNCSCSQ